MFSISSLPLTAMQKIEYTQFLKEKKQPLAATGTLYRRIAQNNKRFARYLKSDAKKVYIGETESSLPQVINADLAQKKYAKRLSKVFRKLLNSSEKKTALAVLNNKKFKLNRGSVGIGGFGYRVFNYATSIFFKSSAEVELYFKLNQAKNPVNFYFVYVYTKLVNNKNWLRSLISSANYFDYEIYFSQTKNINTNYYSNDYTKSLIKNSTKLSLLSEKWSGFFLWESTTMKKIFNLSILFSLFGSFKNKFKLNRNSSPVAALSQIASNSFFNKIFYRNTTAKLNQSWGNSGSYTSKTVDKKKILPLSVMLTSVVEKTYLEKLESKMRIKTEQSKRNIRAGFTKSEIRYKTDQTFVNWIKAGYVLVSSKKDFGSRMKRSGLSTSNFEVMQNSKVFGHPFHLVNPSILPITMCFVFFTLIQDLLSSFWLEMWYSNILSVLAHGTMVGLFFSVILTWILEIYSEEQAGFHTIEVQKGFQYGILLFILSELMLFISFFWAYFHFSLNSNSFTGGSYTPIGLVPFFWYRIPLLNTLLLLSSGLSLTIAHILISESDKLVKLFIWLEALSYRLTIGWRNLLNLTVGGFKFFSKANSKSEGFYIAITARFMRRVQQFGTKAMLSRDRTLLMSELKNSKFIGQSDKVGRVSNDFQVNLPKSFVINFRSMSKNTAWQPNFWILDTVLKGFVFLVYQAYEYTSCMFSMNDGVYGAVFFSLTGLHGTHVFLGVMFLFFSLLVNLKKKFRKSIILIKKVNRKINNILEKGFFAKSSYNEKVWTHRTAFDGAAWYWHFVDVVWLFVFVFIYWWGFSGDVA